MDGIHDLGGKQGYGPVDTDDPRVGFHERWEARVFAINRAVAVAGARRNVDQFRHAVERIDPAAYLTHGYYGRWLGAVENLLVEAGMLTSEAITARAVTLGGAADAPLAARPAARPDPIDYAAPEGFAGTARRPVDHAPRFATGEAVRTRSWPSAGHTRLPAYVRGRDGRIVACHGGWVLPDTNAHGLGEQPTHLYTVAFAGEELWGAAAEPCTEVRIDLFEPYLEQR